MNTNENGEIDLQELAIRILRYFYRHSRFIIFSCLGGILSGLVAWLTLPPVYQSKMIVMSDILTSSYSDRITESLNKLVGEGNYVLLGARLGLSEEEVKQVAGVEIESIKKADQDNKEEATIFIITADTKNQELLPKLQEGIINLLRNNEFVKIRVKQREFFNRTLIEKLDDEIRSLDSLKKRVFEGKPIYGKGPEMLLVDPTNIYSKIIELNRQRVEYVNALELSNSIQLVEGFTSFKKPKSPRGSVALLLGLLGGLVFSLGSLTFRHLAKLAFSTKEQSH